MSDPGNASLEEFGGDGGAGGDERPPEEAEHVAGNGGGQSADVVDPERESLPEARGEVTLRVMQVDYTIEGRGSDERPVVHVFGRTTDGDREHVRVHGFEPYFYVPASTVDVEQLRRRDRITGVERDEHRSIRGEELVKVKGQTPRDVGQIRDEFDHYEADVLFPNRLLVDKGIQSGVRVPERREPGGEGDGERDGGSDDGRDGERDGATDDERDGGSEHERDGATDDGKRAPIDVHHEEVEPADVLAEPRVHTLDIEVDDRRGFPEDGEEPIVCLTAHDSYRDEYVGWVFEPPEADDWDWSEELADYEQLTDDDGEYARVDVRAFDDEPAMLDDYLGYVEETDGDVLTGWNFDDFDAPYLLDRLEELDGRIDVDRDLSIERLSRVDEVWRSSWGAPDVKGRVVFDLLYAYQRTQFTELDSYRLDDVAEQELGVGKERYPGDIGDLWEDDPERLLEYNLRDVELCVELDRQQDVIAFWDEVRTFVGCKLEDATTPGDAVDMYVLHKVHGDFVLPSKGQQEGEEYEGGAVFDPITGVRENVSVLDLKCFSGDTDLLTPDGVRNIEELEEGDPIYTLNPETFECEVKPVEETHQYENEYGELHHLSGNTHDFKVTENHRFLASKERGWDDLDPEDYEFAEYRDLIDSERYAFPNHEPVSGERPETFELVEEVDGGHVVVYSEEDLRRFRNAVPEAVTAELELLHGSSEAMALQQRVGKYLVPISVYRQHEEVITENSSEVFLKYGPQHRETPLEFEMVDWLEFLGWYVTEGSIDKHGDRITIHQSDGREKDDICELLDRMEVNHNVDSQGVNVSNRFLQNWLVENCGKGYAEKRLPEWVFDLDAELLSTLLETLIDGDGSRTESGLRKFWTKSTDLRDAIVEIAVRCGHKPTVSTQKDGTFYVSVGKRGSFKKSSNATVEEHDGDVYCVTAADNHVVLAGRNGHFQWIGQSLYPMCMVTTNASPETKVDPEAYDGETYVAPNGTHFRKEPDGVIREMVDELLGEREQKKELRDEHDPDSRDYDRYDRQQAAVKVIMNCFTPDADVLTPDGVRNIRDLEVGDEVYSLDPDSMELEVKPVVDTHEYPDYRGDLVDIQTSKIDFRVTPNHRMLVRQNDANGITEDGWDFIEAGDLYDCCHYELPHGWDSTHADSLPGDVDIVALVREHTDAEVTISDGGASVCAQYGSPNVSRYVDTDDFLQFLAWFVAEGSVYHAKTDNYRVKIAQEGAAARDRIEDLVESFTGYCYSTERSVSFSSKLWAELLESLCGGKSDEKRIPPMVFEASESQKREFLDTLIEGDGDRQPNSWCYSTISEQLRDDVLRLCLHLGLTPSYNKDSGTWRIYVTEDGKNSMRMYRDGSQSQAESGVYCVTVADNNTLCAGRNGKFQFVGNSLYGVLGWDRFRLYDKEMGAAVTATGREVIEHTQDAANELDKEVIYGDTDSVMLELGGDVSKEEAIEQSFEIEEHINESYDEFAREALNAHVHRFQIEFEKLYRRFFQAGKKKRYAGHIVWSEGKDVDDIDITGFEYQRSDIAPITKRVQHEVIEMIVHGEDVDDVVEYLREVIEDFTEGNVDPEQVGIPGGIGKRLDNYETDTAQVRGAKYANLLLGTNFDRGSKPTRLYLEGVHPDFFQRMEAEEGLDPQRDPLYRQFKEDVRDGDGVICIEYADQLPEEFQVDWEKMLDRTLKGPIERILEALDVTWEEVESGQEQTGLESFM